MLYLEEPFFVSSTERPNKKPDLTKKPVTPHKEKVNFFLNFMPIFKTYLIECQSSSINCFYYSGFKKERDDTRGSIFANR